VVNTHLASKSATTNNVCTILPRRFCDVFEKNKGQRTRTQLPKENMAVVFFFFLTTLICLLSVRSMKFRLGGSTAKELKTKILDLSEKVNRGLTETKEDREAILDLFGQLEKKNPNKNTLSNPSLNAVWELKYTTSDSILGRGGGGTKVGPILQTINAKNLTAENSEVIV